MTNNTVILSETKDLNDNRLKQLIVMILVLRRALRFFTAFRMTGNYYAEHGDISLTLNMTNNTVILSETKDLNDRELKPLITIIL